MSEKDRRLPLELFYKEGMVEAGVDEAGRGCLAGPVVAAAVILPPDFSNDRLYDSKQMTANDRSKLAPVIKEKAIAWSVGEATPQEVDKVNVLQATFVAMHRAIAQLVVLPELLLIDGHLFKPYEGIKHICIVKGDTKYTSIAAASVLAKTHRDEYMQKQAALFPEYGWRTNKGYPTKAHKKAIIEHGLTLLHRRTFKGCLIAAEGSPADKVTAHKLL